MFWCKYILVKYWNVLAIIKMLNFSIVEKLWGKKMTEWQLWTKSRDDFMTKIMLTQTSLHKINSQTDFSMYVIIFDLSNACKKTRKFFVAQIRIEQNRNYRKIQNTNICTATYPTYWKLSYTIDLAVGYSYRLQSIL